MYFAAENSTGDSLVSGIGVAGSKVSEGKLLQVVLVSPQVNLLLQFVLKINTISAS